MKTPRILTVGIAAILTLPVSLTAALFLFGSTLKVSAGTSNTQFNASTLFSSGANVIQVTPANLTTGTYTSIDLSITAIDNPKWTGAVDGNWDGSTLN